MCCRGPPPSSCVLSTELAVCPSGLAGVRTVAWRNWTATDLNPTLLWRLSLSVFEWFILLTCFGLRAFKLPWSFQQVPWWFDRNSTSCCSGLESLAQGTAVGATFLSVVIPLFPLLVCHEPCPFPRVGATAMFLETELGDKRTPKGVQWYGKAMLQTRIGLSSPCKGLFNQS